MGEISARPFPTDNHFKKTCQSDSRRDVTSGGPVAQNSPFPKRKKLMLMYTESFSCEASALSEKWNIHFL